MEKGSHTPIIIRPEEVPEELKGGDLYAVKFSDENEEPKVAVYRCYIETEEPAEAIMKHQPDVFDGRDAVIHGIHPEGMYHLNEAMRREKEITREKILEILQKCAGNPL